jgi:CAAX protease family protein
MDPENTDTPQIPASDQPPLPSIGRPPQWKNVFLNEQGLRAGWRIGVYIFLVVFCGFVVTFLFRTFYHGPRTGPPSAPLLFLQESLSFAIAFLPAWFMAWLERRPVGDYGLPLRSAFGGHFWKGCALGIAEIGVLMGLIAAFHGYSFGSLNLSGTAIYKWAIFWLFFFILVGLFEEFLFRGYLQFTLADGIGFWPAAWILSLTFGGLHRLNGGESWVGAAGVAMIALIFSFTLRRTGNLWFVVGWHAAFDFGETFLFSVPNSGQVFEGHLSNSTLHGPTWLTGGTVGPEGSVFSFITMAAAALLIHKAFPDRKSANAPLAAPVRSGISPQ